MPDRRVRVARFGAAHGIRGEVRLISFTAEPAAVATYGPFESADGARRFEIAAMRPAKDGFVVRVAGVSDRTAAEALRNIDLFVPRERLPPPEPDEFYHADLVGLTAVTEAGERVGAVVAVHNFGAGDVIEIDPRTGAQTLMLPFTRAAAPVVDIPGGRIVVVPPEEDA